MRSAWRDGARLRLRAEALRLCAVLCGDCPADFDFVLPVFFRVLSRVLDLCGAGAVVFF